MKKSQTKKLCKISCTQSNYVSLFGQFFQVNIFWQKKMSKNCLENLVGWIDVWLSTFDYWLASVTRKKLHRRFISRLLIMWVLECACAINKCIPCTALKSVCCFRLLPPTGLDFWADFDFPSEHFFVFSAKNVWEIYFLDEKEKKTRVL